MRLLNDVEDVRRLVYGSRVAVVAYLGKDESLNSYVTSVLKALEEVSKGAIVYGSYRVSGDLEDATVVVYVDGKEVLEQKFYFMKLELDVRALKMGIREVMRSLGLRTPF